MSKQTDGILFRFACLREKFQRLVETALLSDTAKEVITDPRQTD